MVCGLNTELDVGACVGGGDVRRVGLGLGLYDWTITLFLCEDIPAILFESGSE